MLYTVCARPTNLVCFAGRSFEFMGDVGKFYSLISERSHQLTMRLKLGQMFDHNGTYMDVSVANLPKGMRCFDHALAVRNRDFRSWVSDAWVR